MTSIKREDLLLLLDQSGAQWQEMYGPLIERSLAALSPEEEWAIREAWMEPLSEPGDTSDKVRRDAVEKLKAILQKEGVQPQMTEPLLALAEKHWASMHGVLDQEYTAEEANETIDGIYGRESQKKEPILKRATDRGAAPSRRSASSRSSTLRLVKWTRYAVAAVLVIGISYTGLRFSTLPATYDIASIAEYNGVLGDRIARSTNLPAWRSALSAGALALLAAPETKWGVFKGYNQQAVSQAIGHLRDAYELAPNTASREEIAFYLAKAHLMQEHTDSARIWLDHAIEEDADVFEEDARHLLSSIDALHAP